MTTQIDEQVAIGSYKIDALRKLIESKQLEESDIVLVTPFHFDEIALDYRIENGAGLPLPFYLSGVKVEVDPTGKVRPGRVGITHDFVWPIRTLIKDLPTAAEQKAGVKFLNTVYRCGWCGAIKDKYGNDLPDEQEYAARATVTALGDARTVKVTGNCCRDKQ